MKFKEMLEAVELTLSQKYPNKRTMNREATNYDMAVKFNKMLEKEFKKHFPNGEIVTGIGQYPGSSCIHIRIASTPSKNYDSMSHGFSITTNWEDLDFGVDNLTFHVDGGSILQLENYKTIKTGMMKYDLNKKMSLVKAGKIFKAWFPKLKKLAQKHQDNYIYPIKDKYKV